MRQRATGGATGAGAAGIAEGAVVGTAIGAPGAQEPFAHPPVEPQVSQPQPQAGSQQRRSRLTWWNTLSWLPNRRWKKPSVRG
jgi:hypothetical protein